MQIVKYLENISKGETFLTLKELYRELEMLFSIKVRSYSHGIQI